MTTDLRARAEELLTENADADRPDPRSWMDAADRIIRDILAALPPDPAPTGERTDDAWPLLVAVERAREAIDAEEERRKVPTWSMLRTTLAEAEASLRVYTRRRMRDDAKVAPRG